jgi:hypothetical protein
MAKQTTQPIGSQVRITPDQKLTSNRANGSPTHTKAVISVEKSRESPSAKTIETNENWMSRAVFN